MTDNFDNYEFDEFEESDAEAQEAPKAETGNRTFLIVTGILGAILIISLICMAVYAMVILPRNRDKQAAQVAAVETQNAEVQAAALKTQQAAAAAISPTPTSTQTQAASPTPTKTQVVAPTQTPLGGIATQDPRTATVAALLTSQAGGGTTITPAATGLPDTGFADEVGIPGLVTMAAILVLVIFFARRLRTAG